MKSPSKFVVLLGLVIIVALAIPLSILLHRAIFQSPLRVVNNSNIYELHYESNPEFLEALKKWEVFSTDTYDINNKKTKIKNIEVNLVDTPQELFAATNENNELLHSSSYELSKNGNLKVYVHLDKEYASSEKNEEVLIEYVEYDVLRSVLDQVMNVQRKPNVQSQQVDKILNSYYTSGITNPFHVEIIE